MSQTPGASGGLSDPTLSDRDHPWRPPRSAATALAPRLAATRALTPELCAPLAAEDMVLQSMPDASPPKWHLAHTTWFFEHFVLARLPGYRCFDPAWGYLFNSYYESVGSFHPRQRRGLLSRPTTAQVLAYRAHVDGALQRLLDSHPAPDLLAVIELGLHHEQQHQELLLMDVKHHLGTQPLHPAYREDLPTPRVTGTTPLRFVAYPGGVHEIGHAGPDFCFDNETPRHRVYVAAFRLGHRLVTNSEWLEFMRAGGYTSPTLWLSDGWAAVQQRGWNAPLYWQGAGDEWQQYTLGGLRPVRGDAPVVHICYYEADAYARYAGRRLPTEAEWELAAAAAPVQGNFLHAGALEPVALEQDPGHAVAQLYGDAWEWTASPYAPYPGYRPLAGALGEYNGKFMSSQMVLRGGAAVTPAGHVRSTYRNFYPPDARWAYSGLRLAEDV